VPVIGDPALLRKRCFTRRGEHCVNATKGRDRDQCVIEWRSILSPNLGCVEIEVEVEVQCESIGFECGTCGV